jgi:CRP-like cAMP-binding protein
MHHPLISRLETYCRLSDEERSAILKLSQLRLRQLRPREDLVQEDQRPRDLHLILTGWAYRYKMLEDGRRQTLSVLIGGDFCDLDHHLLGAMDHSIAALSPLCIAEIPHAHLEAVTARFPNLAQAFRWTALVDGSIEREWIVNLGQRNAIERIAHLLCEIYCRMRAIGQVSDQRCEFPMTQADIGEATGLTVVHVNRTLQELRRIGLISLSGKELVVHDEPGLARAGLFNPKYLHLAPAGAADVPVTA